MRLIANVPENEEGVRRLMIFQDEADTYLFGFNRVPDGDGMWDEWYETIADAKEAAQRGYQVLPGAWTQIADPCDYCQHDWIRPVRVKGRNLGQPEWGKLEHLLDGQWLEFNPEE